MSTFSKDDKDDCDYDVVGGNITFGLWPKEFLIFQRVVGAEPSALVSSRFIDDIASAFVEAFSSDDPVCYPIVGNKKGVIHILETMDNEIEEIEELAFKGDEGEILIKISISSSTIDFLSWMESRFNKTTRRCIRYLIHFGYLQKLALQNKSKNVYIEFLLPTLSGGLRQHFLDEIIQMPYVSVH